MSFARTVAQGQSREFRPPVPNHPVVESPSSTTPPVARNIRGTLSADTFLCPKEVEVYLTADRFLPLETINALSEMIEVTIKTFVHPTPDSTPGGFLL